MPARPLVVLTATALVCFGCRTPDPHAGEPIVRAIHLEGTHAISAREIKKRIATGETSWIPFSTPAHFDPDIWRSDLRRIERLYRARGYYQAKVTSNEVRPAGKNRVDLSARVEEGSPTRVVSITLHGLEGLPTEHAATIREGLRLKEGDLFLEDDWEHAKDHLAQALRDLGYADATVSGEARVDVATQRADLELNVNPGARLRFGTIAVTQHPDGGVEAWRILERASRDVREGDWYSDHALTAAQRRVSQMGVFGGVKVRRLPTDGESETVPVDVDVQRSPLHSIRYGFGIAVDQTRNDARVRAEYENRDFLGGLRRLTLGGEAGWAFLPDIASALTGAEGTENGPVAKLSAELEQPRLFRPDLRARARVELERGIEPAYTYFGGRSKEGLVWQPVDALSIEPSYNFEAYRLGRGMADLLGTAPPLLFGCPKVCTLSYLEERVTWDKRDDRLEPKRGYYLALGVQEGGGWLGGSFQYVRVEPEARGYVSFGAERRFTLAARAHVGTLIPKSGNDTDSPIVARFFSGGNEMRGFSNRRLSPMYIAPNPNPKDPYTGLALPIGGDGVFDASVEARWNIWEALVLAVFTDSGFVTTERVNFADAAYFSRNMLYAVGAGARYRTPVGPIRFDFAYRLNVGPSLEVYPSDPSLTWYSPRGCFGIGGKNGARAGAPEDPCTIQLSIGEAF